MWNSYIQEKTGRLKVQWAKFGNRLLSSFSTLPLNPAKTRSQLNI